MTLRELLRCGLVALAGAGLCGPVLAQRTPVYQSGTINTGDAAKFDTNGTVSKAGNLLGDANGRGVNPHAITDSNALGLCSNSALSGSEYNALCLGHKSTGDGLISLDSYNGLENKDLFFRINGVETSLSDLITNVEGVGYTPLACDGYSSSTATVTTTGGVTTLADAGASFTADDVGKPLTASIVGSNLSYGTGTVTTPGTGMRVGDITTLTGGVQVQTYKTKAVSVSISAPNAGSGGIDGPIKMRGTTGGGFKKFRIAANVVSGAIDPASVTLDSAGEYTSDLTDITNEPLAVSSSYSNTITGVVASVTMGAKDVIGYTRGSFASAPGATLSQTATTGAGSGLVVTPQWDGTPLRTTIATVVDAHTITLTAAATADASNVLWAYGTDYGSTWADALAAGHRVLMPKGKCYFAQQITVPQGGVYLGSGAGVVGGSGTELLYGGTATPAIVTAATGTWLNDVAVGNFTLNLLGAGTDGVRLRGVRNSTIGDIYARNYRGIGIALDTAADGSGFELNMIGRLNASSDNAYNAAGSRQDIRWSPGVTSVTGDVHNNNFGMLYANPGENAVGFACYRADSQRVAALRSNATTNGVAIRFYDSATDPACVSNIFWHMAASGPIVADTAQANIPSNNTAFINETTNTAELTTVPNGVLRVQGNRGRFEGNWDVTRGALLPGFGLGCTLTKTTGNTFRVDSCRRADATTGATMVRNATRTRTLSQVFGTQAENEDEGSADAGPYGCNDTGSVAINTWYAVFMIAKDMVRNAPDFLCSTSATAPTMPSGWTLKALVGFLLTDGSGNIVDFVQNGDEFLFTTPIQVLNGASFGTSSTQQSISAGVPSGVPVTARLRAKASKAAATPCVLFTRGGDTSTVDSPGGNVSMCSQTAGVAAAGEFNVYVGTNATLRIAASTASTLISAVVPSFRVPALNWPH